jgi:integrase
VRRSLWKGRFIGPKTRNAIRAVDLAPKVLAALREAKPVRPPEEIATQLIFSRPNGLPLEPDNFVKRRFLPALRRAELPRIRFHDLRHTYASLLILDGQDPKYVQMSLGHASIQTTLDRYGHLIPGAYAHGGERLERTVLGDEPLPRP